MWKCAFWPAVIRIFVGMNPRRCCIYCAQRRYTMCINHNPVEKRPHRNQQPVHLFLQLSHKIIHQRFGFDIGADFLLNLVIRVFDGRMVALAVDIRNGFV